MTHLLIRHGVEDYDEWKPVFDDHGTTREGAGSRGGQLFRAADDPEDLVILFEWDTAENAREFVESADLRETMERAGVAGEPEVHVLEKAEDVDV